jgi:predicted alpha/beta-hydrolase family hydrolase
VSDVAGVVLFPGAGSSSQHTALLAIEEALAPIAVARVDFPYRKAGKSFPDKTPVLIQCVRDEVRAFAAGLGVDTSRIIIGGRSMGGRMCSMAIADQDDPLDVAGLVLVSYPLHPPKKPDQLRTEHLGRLDVPVLCISGTRDDFGSPDEMTEAFSVVPGTIDWRWVDKGRHELKGCDQEVARHVADWVTSRGGGPRR